MKKEIKTQIVEIFCLLKLDTIEALEIVREVSQQLPNLNYIYIYIYSLEP